MAIGHDNIIKLLDNVYYLVVNISKILYLTKRRTINILTQQTFNTSMEIMWSEPTGKWINGKLNITYLKFHTGIVPCC